MRLTDSYWRTGRTRCGRRSYCHIASQWYRATANEGRRVILHMMPCPSSSIAGESGTPQPERRDCGSHRGFVMKLILAFGVLVMLIGLGCAEELTEQEVRQIVQEYSVPGPEGDKGNVGPQGPRATGVTWDLRAIRVTVAMLGHEVPGAIRASLGQRVPRVIRAT